MASGVEVATLERSEEGSYAALGLCLVVLVVMVLGGWAAVAKLAGAVVTGGVLVAETSPKRVQHAEGGIVAEIFARNGDRVGANQPLVRLDDTRIRAGLEIVASQLNLRLALEARLSAEAHGESNIQRPALFLGERAAEEEQLLAEQSELMGVRRSLLEGELDQLSQQVAQYTSEIEGLKARREALLLQRERVVKERDRLEGLLQQKLIPETRVFELNHSLLQLDADIASTNASIHQSEALVLERKVLVSQASNKFRNDTLIHLEKVRAEIGELQQKEITAEDNLRRLVIRSPQDGVVHESVVATINGVIPPGETIMSIIPAADELVAEVRVSPMDVDKLSVGQAAIIRFPGIDVRTAPEVAGHIEEIAPDLSLDPLSGARYYSARLALERNYGSIAKLGTGLVSGMPVEGYLQTGERTVLDYLLAPLLEQLNRTMNED